MIARRSHPNDPPTRLVIRPRRLRQLTCLIAAVVAGAFVWSGLTLSGTTSQGGQLFELDRWALVGVGVLLGAVTLTPLRVRVVATMEGIHVYNLVGDVAVSWSAIQTVRYQRGALSASLDLTTGHIVTMLAVQVIDGQRAVDAIRALRAIQKLHVIALHRRGTTGGDA